MFVFVASVHHTGTQFVQKLFEDADYQITDLTPKEAGNSVNYLHRSHIADAVMTELDEWLNLGIPVIVPLRHPMAVAKSWLARKKPIEEMIRQFQILVELVDPFGPLYLPIDHEHRELFLSRIRHECGSEIVTDWPIVASKVEGSDHQAQLKPVEPNHDEYRQLETLQGCELLNRFYPDWRLL